MRLSVIALLCAIYLANVARTDPSPQFDFVEPTFLTLQFAVPPVPIPGQCGPSGPEDYPEPLPNPDGMKLRHVTVVHRHGDRTPASHKAPTYACWPHGAEWDCDDFANDYVDFAGATDPASRVYTRKFGLSSLNPGTCLQGQLTPKGFRQHFYNGVNLRKRYTVENNLLPPQPNNDIMYLRATDFPRTVLSLQAILLGYYSDGASCEPGQWDINVKDLALENMFPNPKLCPILDSMEKKWKQSSRAIHFEETVVRPHLEAMSKVLNVPFKYMDSEGLFDCLYAHVCNNKAPAAVTNELYQQSISNLLFEYRNVANITSSAARYSEFASASFISEILEQIEPAQSGESERRIAIFSGHDTTLLPLLDAYGVWNGHWPGYASTLAIELFESTDSDEWFVRFVYEGRVLALPACGRADICPYPLFLKESQRIAKLVDECRLNTE